MCTEDKIATMFVDLATQHPGCASVILQYGGFHALQRAQELRTPERAFHVREALWSLKNLFAAISAGPGSTAEPSPAMLTTLAAFEKLTNVAHKTNIAAALAHLTPYYFSHHVLLGCGVMSFLVNAVFGQGASEAGESHVGSEPEASEGSEGSWIVSEELRS